MVQPAIELIVLVLQKCRVENAHRQALHLYAIIQRDGLEGHKLIGNNLVLLLVDMGSLLDATGVFERLVFQNQWSWNALISAHMKQERPECALILYQIVQDNDSLRPTVHTFLALLQACSILKDLGKGLLLHSEIARTGLLEQEPFLGSKLVDMYAKCGLLANSQEVFDHLTVQDAVSWNALIAGFSRLDNGEKALSSFERMQSVGVPPDAFTYVCALKACGTVGLAEKVQELHAEIEKKGLSRENPFLANTLIDMYVKCGLLESAQFIFDRVQARDVVSWNVLIAGYCEHGQGKQAVHLFQQMQYDGVSTDAVTLVCGLRACGSTGDYKMGQATHAEVARKGLMRRESIGNTLVDMYGKFGLLAKAQEVFKVLHVRNIVSWNAIIAGYSNYGYGEDALRFYDQMQLDGFSPDATTSICSLKACGFLRALEKGLEIHSEIGRKGLLEMDITVGGALVDMYARCGVLAKAREVFQSLPIRDSVSWTALIAGYAERGHGETALRYFEQMQMEDISPDGVTFVSILKACGCIGAIEKGHELHASIEREGNLHNDLAIGNSLIDMYSRSGLLTKAQTVFDMLLVRDVVSWNSLIAGYAEHGLDHKAVQCFDHMQLSGILPDSVTYVSSLKACGSIGAIEKGKDIHSEVERQGLLERDIIVGNALINMYVKCGSLAQAQDVFDKLINKDAITWNTLITGFALLGQSNGHMLDRMLREGKEPDEETFLSILNGCCRTGLSEKGKTYFEAMSKDHGVVPTLGHLTCVVGLLCHIGQLDKAATVIRKSPFCPDLVMWCTLLGACFKFGNTDLASQAFMHAVLLHPTTPISFQCRY